jgi:hypothetical protein
VALVLLLAGCAGTVTNMRELPAGALAPALEPGKTLVVFMRPSGLGFAIQSSVFEVRDNHPSLIGIVAAKTKVAYRVEPGKRLFMVVGESADFMTAELEPNKTYYVEVTPRMGLWKARFSLDPVRKANLDKAEFKRSVDECRWVEKTPASDNWALDNMASIQSKRTEYYADWMKLPAADRPHLLGEDGK